MATFNETTKNWESVIDPGLGPSKVQKFSAPSLEELATKMEHAQLHATQRIHNLSEFMEPDTEQPMPDFKPRQMGADELVAVSVEMQDPTKAAQAVEKIITAVIGATPEEIRTGLKSARTAHLIQHYREETQKFIDATPEYKKSPNNWQAVMTWLDAKKAPPSQKNLLLAFTALKETVGGLPDGINSLEPENDQPTADKDHIDPEKPPERIASAATSTVRPRGSSSSGLRNGTSTVGTPPAPQPKWTKGQVLAMGDKEYGDLYRTSQSFRDFVDKM